MRRRAIQIHPGDNVAVALGPIAMGEILEVGGRTVLVKEPVAAGHKFALSGIGRGEDIVKYGRTIGHASASIREGDWIHSHNLVTALAGPQVYSFRPEVSGPLSSPPQPLPAAFLGYRRRDGRVGTRNEIWIIPTVGCVNAVALRLAALANERFKGRGCDGVYAFPHPHGCSQLGADLEDTKKVLASLMGHPNAGGVLAVGLGCETLGLDLLTGAAAGPASERLRTLSVRDVPDEAASGLRAVEELVALLGRDRRSKEPVSELVLGMKCGGSDGLSGITANPLVGRVADWAAAMNGTVLLSEVPEMFGAEQSLLGRARDEAVFTRLAALLNAFKRDYLDRGLPVHENPSPGNLAGGITTLEEKSLGAVAKGGSAAVTQVLEYGERVTERGLAVVAAPGNDIVSSTALAAAGAAVLLFTTGCGTPFGGVVPTIKISTNSDLARMKPGWIDFDAGRLLETEVSPGELAEALVRLVVDVASGTAVTKSEAQGSRDIAIWKTGVTL